ncbi:hypothetical protein F3Y22_tig00009023pilonHSYRG00133 [Hibiscus syriacus]|uniref:Uncharacterized protein n=1 Tax=Hibiscus syriacus TaxID=106335 RepID=A0A6A3CCW1_HIBSY|nr:hypothetical protein F3Y22_tig00009023pilonHSYRG00133 [Hibiscus syriacus]
MWTCTMNRLFGKCDIPIVALGTFPTGLALAVEKKSRRMEISLYCLARAIESFFTCMADVGYLPKSMNLKRADVVIFSLSTAIIMHCYAQEREVFRSKYLSVLDWVFGVPPPPCLNPSCGAAAGADVLVFMVAVIRSARVCYDSSQARTPSRWNPKKAYYEISSKTPSSDSKTNGRGADFKSQT